MKAIVVLAVALTMPAAVLAQEGHAAAPQHASKGESSVVVVTHTAAKPAPATKSAAPAKGGPSLLEVAERVRKIVEAHEQDLAADHKGATKKTVAAAAHTGKGAPATPRVTTPAQRAATATPRVGLVWRVSLVWPEELRAATYATAPPPHGGQ